MTLVHMGSTKWTQWVIQRKGEPKIGRVRRCRLDLGGARRELEVNIIQIHYKKF